MHKLIPAILIAILAILLPNPALASNTFTPPAIKILAKNTNSNTRIRTSQNLLTNKWLTPTKMVVKYHGFSVKAKKAFQKAVDIWARYVSSSQPIVIEANWSPLGPGVLGSARATTYIRDFDNAPYSKTWYPIGLANKLAGKDLAPNKSDIICNFNSNFQNWYYGTDGNTPAGKYDLLSVVLHEIGHGLGFAGSGRVNHGLGTWGYQGYPIIWDRFVVTGAGKKIINTNHFPKPSYALKDVLTGGNLYFQDNLFKPKLYAPKPFNQGSSFSHLDEATFPAGNDNSLMTPRIGMAESIHDPGPIVLNMFKVFGWFGQSPNMTIVHLRTFQGLKSTLSRMSTHSSWNKSNFLTTTPPRSISKFNATKLRLPVYNLRRLPPERLRSTYKGPKTPHYSGLHSQAKALFVKADKAYFKATGKYLKINSGTRTVEKQADLYIGWRLGWPGYNPANIPGASIHNYGFAIDIVNARNKEVIKALGDNGWERTVMPKEPWHWEALSASGAKEAQKKQTAMKKPGSIARKWQGQWETARVKNEKRNKQLDELKKKVPLWQKKRDQLIADGKKFDADVAAYKQKANQYNADVNRFQQRVKQHNREIDALKKLRQRIEGMPPSEERNRLIREYNRRTQAAKKERAALEHESTVLKQRKSKLDAEYKQLLQRRDVLQRRMNDLQKEQQELKKLSDSIKKLEKEIDTHMKKANDILAQIAKIVNPK